MEVIRFFTQEENCTFRQRGMPAPRLMKPRVLIALPSICHFPEVQPPPPHRHRDSDRQVYIHIIYYLLNEKGRSTIAKAKFAISQLNLPKPKKNKNEWIPGTSQGPVIPSVDSLELEREGKSEG